ncbi:MAG: polysaccharide pyruvyl transferase CsaB [Synergistaceae bacterium]|nr:polysaccharide pyruvyl transferase CsaB [Synergistaceae bacterium]
MRRYRVALAGYYGFGNLGDELLAEALVTSLLRHGVERGSIVILTNDAEGAKEKLGIDAVNRWSLADVSRVLIQSETFLLGGGGLFQDATSLRSCFYYWGLVRLAALLEAVPWAVGQSVGPFSTRLGPWLARDALKRCRVLHVRDKASLFLCENWKFSPSPKAGHDPVLFLGDAFSAFLRVSRDEEVSPRLLVNLRPHPGGLPERFAEAISAYARTFAGEVVGVALSAEDEALMNHLAQEEKISLSRVERVTSLREAAQVFSGAAGAAGMRLHFAILAGMARIPLVAAPYDPKVEAFAADCGVPLWREGPLPQPRAASLPSLETVKEEINILYTEVLSS